MLPKSHEFPAVEMVEAIVGSGRVERPNKSLPIKGHEVGRRQGQEIDQGN